MTSFGDKRVQYSQEQPIT